MVNKDRYAVAVTMQLLLSPSIRNLLQKVSYYVHVN